MTRRSTWDLGCGCYCLGQSDVVLMVFPLTQTKQNVGNETQLGIKGMRNKMDQTFKTYRSVKRLLL